MMHRTVVPEYRVMRDGVELTKLLAPDNAAGNVRMNAESNLKMSFSGTFLQNPLCDWLIDRLRPYLVIDGTPYPVGEYVITEEKPSYQNGVYHVELTGYDNTYLAQRTKLEERITLAAGNRYTDVIQALFIAAGVEKIICEDSAERLKSDREDWEIGTDHLTIANELLQEINYDSAWADAVGIIHLESHREPSAGNIRHTYSAGETSIIEERCQKTNDLHAKSNVFRAEVNNPDLDEIMVAVAVNDDPSHPLCVQRLGRIQAPVERLNNIASKEELQTYVDNVKFASMLATEEIEFYTALNPVHGVNDVVAVNHPAIQGIYLETEWGLTLAAGAQMTHRARRVMYL